MTELEADRLAHALEVAVIFIIVATIYICCVLPAVVPLLLDAALRGG